MLVASLLPYFLAVIVKAVANAEPTCTSVSEPTSHLKRLKEGLFRDYDSSVRPVRVWSDRTKVAVEMIPLSLDFDEYYDVFTLHSSMHFAWKDEFLTWNASDYGGIKHILLDGYSVWVPEVFHLTTWDISDLKEHKRMCNLFSSGWLHCWHYATLTTLCRLDLTYWPYDFQNCTVTLSTVTQSEEEIELMVMGAPVNLKQYIPSLAWQLLTVGYSQYSHIFGDKVFPCLQYNFLLRRNDVIAEVTIVVPMILFVVLMLASFWLNSQQDARLNLSCTLLACHILFLQDIGHITNGDEAPVIVLFFRDSLVLCVLSLQLAVFMQWLNSTSPREIPDSLNDVFEKGPTWMLLLLGRSCPHGSKTQNDEGEDTGNKAPLPDIRTRWLHFGSLLNLLFFLLYCFIYLVLIIMYVL